MAILTVVGTNFLLISAVFRFLGGTKTVKPINRADKVCILHIVLGNLVIRFHSHFFKFSAIFQNRMIVLWRVAAGVLLPLVPTLAVFGNFLVILAVFQDRILQTVTNMLIVSLAGSDLMVSYRVIAADFGVGTNLE